MNHVQIWFSSSLKYFVLISLQVGIRPNLPDWFQLCSEELNPCNHQKGWSLLHRRREKTHTGKQGFQEETHTKTDITTSSLNRPSGRFKRNLVFFGILYSPQALWFPCLLSEAAPVAPVCQSPIWGGPSNSTARPSPVKPSERINQIKEEYKRELAVKISEN